MRENHADFSWGNHPQAKAVENIKTGVVYGAMSEASEKEGIPMWKLIRCLSGKAVNTTNLKFVDNILINFLSGCGSFGSKYL